MKILLTSLLAISTAPAAAFVTGPRSSKQYVGSTKSTLNFIINKKQLIASSPTKKTEISYLPSSVLERTEEVLLTVEEVKATISIDKPKVSAAEEVKETIIIDEPKVSELPDYLKDGFIFGLDGSGLSREKGKVAQVVVEGDTLETTPFQFAFVSSTFMTHAIVAASSVFEITTQFNNGSVFLGILQSVLIMLVSWVSADFGSGVLHWSVDNYGNGRTPVMGGIIAAFQGHHTAPWTITERGFSNNVHKLCIPFGIPTILLISAISGPYVRLFFAIFCALEIGSQEFHKWTHQKAKEVPGWGNSLMKWGLVLSRQGHSIHHTVPFKDNYCIVSGFCNDFVDNSGFFRWLEHQVYKINGIESNAWKIEPKLKERTLRGEYAPKKRR